MTTRRSSPPTRGCRGAVALAAALAAGAALTGCGGGQQVDWAVVESGPAGRTLMIAPVGTERGCEYKVDVRESNANRVTIKLMQDGSCEASSSSPSASPISVKLAQPLRGQKISGPGLQPPSAYRGAKTATTTPSVVGLRVPDATAILEARGLEVGSIYGPAVAATEITSQSPPAGTPLPTDAGAATLKVSLRTVPR